MAVNLDDVVKLAEQLDPEQQNLLIYRLRVKQMAEQPAAEVLPPAPARRHPDEWVLRRGSEYVDDYRSPSREELLEDAEQLRRTPANPDQRLLGKYANPNAPQMSAEEFHAQMHAVATEWEQELDAFTDDES